MNKKSRIICCYPHLTSSSTAKVVGCSQEYVLGLWKSLGFPKIKKDANWAAYIKELEDSKVGDKVNYKGKVVTICKFNYKGNKLFFFDKMGRNIEILKCSL